jgi:hypothetical protein
LELFKEENMMRQDLIDLANQMARFTVPQKIRINQAFLDQLIADKAIEVADGTVKEFGLFKGLPVIIDNTIPTFKFE